MRSGWAKARESAFQVWNSTTLNCAAPSSPSAVSICSSGSWPGSSAGSSRPTPAISPCCACFWKNSSPAMPSGARTSATGRPRRWGSISGATRA